jgi:hypothetical protein
MSRECRRHVGSQGKPETLHIAYHDYAPLAGGADAPVALLLHGFPYDPLCYHDVATRLARDGVRSIVPCSVSGLHWITYSLPFPAVKRET